MSRFQGSASSAFNMADADHVVTCPSRQIARAIASSARGSTVSRLYRYAHLQKQCDMGNVLGVVPGDSNFTSSWASHGAEIALVFNNSNFPNPLNPALRLHCNWTTDEAQLIGTFQNLWGSMAATGIPADTRAKWPVFGLNEQTLILATPVVHAEVAKVDDCDFWDSLNSSRVG